MSGQEIDMALVNSLKKDEARQVLLKMRAIELTVDFFKDKNPQIEEFEKQYEKIYKFLTTN